MANVMSLNKISMRDIAQVGGKGASLGEMIQNLGHEINVPPGFCVTASAFACLLQHNQLGDKIQAELDGIDVEDIRVLQKKSRRIRRWILNSVIPPKIEQLITKQFQRLKDDRAISVAVRSSATCEDLPTASFAGLHDSFVHVRSKKALLQAIKGVFASLYNERAIAYRHNNQFSEHTSRMAAVVQVMVPSSQAVSGVMFTLDPESGFREVVTINAVYGLGEAIVSGKLTPDEYCVFKPSLEKKKHAILKKRHGHMTKKLVFRQGSVMFDSVTQKQSEQYCLSDAQIEQLAHQAVAIERHYGQAMDIEWAQDPRDRTLYIVQARPETVVSQVSTANVIQYHLSKVSSVICTGRSVGSAVGSGDANVIRSANDMHHFKPGSVLVTDNTDPAWEPIMKQASAIVTNRGGRTCHAAIIARELGVPAVVGSSDATQRIKQGQPITVSCASGDEGLVFDGILPYQKVETPLSDLPKLPVELSMNLGNPDQAFAYQTIPNAGVGLARIEFIIANKIGIHPKALLNFKALPKKMQNAIQQKMIGYKNGAEFYVDQLTQGMATLAAAFFPKPVIFRFSDFKSNEYMSLLGGELFEPREENPMLGYRGASRYVHPDFQDCFALECAALKRVRDHMGLINAQAMIPFVRTVPELQSVVELISKNGLRRKKKGLQIYVMCETPSCALLAEEFLPYCDGFSIGSNDLTQLTLGVDRDSDIIASTFDERDPAVKALIKNAILSCRKQNKYVGICGQGPSDYPDFAAWLIQEGIQSLSLNPDSIVTTWLQLTGRLLK